MRSEERKGLLLVALAALLFSTSPVLIKWADPVSDFVKTWARMLVGAIAVGIAARQYGQANIRTPLAAPAPSVPLPTRTMLRFLAYGLIAAVHFFCAIASLRYTTPAHSLALIYTAPIFVTLLSAWLLHEPVHPRQWTGISVAVLGVAIIAGLEPRFSWSMAGGDALAILSAISFGFYSVAGRYERARYPLFVYASRVYGAAEIGRASCRE